jgi:hypothetical protein
VESITTARVAINDCLASLAGEYKVGGKFKYFRLSKGVP